MIEIQTGKIVIVDPSRRKDIWSKLVIDDCANGFWDYEKTFVDGIPNEFIVSLQGVSIGADWVQVDHEIFTNSKHIAISDYDLFPENGFRDIFDDIRGVTGDLDNEDVVAVWLNDFAYVTLHNHLNWDLGSHVCHVQLNEEGEVVAVKLTFS
jgi:hypothetical protein